MAKNGQDIVIVKAMVKEIVRDIVNLHGPESAYVTADA